ncbi:hypothetical protein GCM10027291_17180 [Telluribacter humicola]
MQSWTHLIWAQDEYFSTQPGKSKPNHSSILGRVHSHYYVRLEGSTTQIRSHLSGDEFYSPYPFGFNFKGGLISGFNYRNKWEIESGIKRMGIYTTYSFDLHKSLGASPGDGTSYRLRVTYWHIPVVLKVVLWQLRKNMTAMATLGAGYSWEGDNGIKMIGPNMSRNGRGLPNGTMLYYTTTDNHTHSSSFFSGETGLEFNWYFIRKLGLTASVKRLFGPDNLLRLDSKLVDDAQGTTYQVKTQAGANGTSVMAGLRYRF